MVRQNELLFRGIERYMYHKSYVTDALRLAEMAKNMCDIEITECSKLDFREVREHKYNVVDFSEV